MGARPVARPWFVTGMLRRRDHPFSLFGDDMFEEPMMRVPIASPSSATYMSSSTSFARGGSRTMTTECQGHMCVSRVEQASFPDGENAASLPDQGGNHTTAHHGRNVMRKQDDSMVTDPAQELFGALLRDMLGGPRIVSHRLRVQPDFVSAEHRGDDQQFREQSTQMQPQSPPELPTQPIEAAEPLRKDPTSPPSTSASEPAEPAPAAKAQTSTIADRSSADQVKHQQDADGKASDTTAVHEMAQEGRHDLRAMIALFASVVCVVLIGLFVQQRASRLMHSSSSSFSGGGRQQVDWAREFNSPLLNTASEWPGSATLPLREV